MTADLPSIRVSSKSRSTTVAYEDAATSENDVLPLLQAKGPHRIDDRGKLLHPKFESNVVEVPTIERVKSVIPSFETKVKVTHQHYEQWARAPTKRSNNTILFRGIQQLKARMKRDVVGEEQHRVEQHRIEQQRVEQPRVEQQHVEQQRSEPIERGVVERETVDRESLRLTRISVIVSADSGERRYPQGLPFRKERTFHYSANTETGFSRSLSYIRNPLTPAPQILDPEMILLESKTTANNNKSNVATNDNNNSCIKSIPKLEKMSEIKLEAYSPGELTKHRFGIARLRDRCPFPVSINQPRCENGHVFLINEPMPPADSMRNKQQKFDVKSDINPKSANLTFDSKTEGFRSAISDAAVHSSAGVLHDSYQKSRSFVGSFSPKKGNNVRTPAVVPSAELFDFSQLTDARQSIEPKPIERYKPDGSLSIKTPKTFRFVPRVQRMRAMIK